MTNAPADLLNLRAATRARTGLGPTAVGIVGDGAHQRTGGYHEGKDVLVMIGRYHGPPAANVGSRNEDYSARMLRDRQGLTNDASAVDIGYQWPNGGNAAWLRFNTLLVRQLTTGDPELAAIRALNYSPDGRTKLRRDRENGWQPEATTDTVDVHTHLEFYRDTEGMNVRLRTISRLGQIIDAAISNTPLGVSGESDMSNQAESILASLANGLKTYTGTDGQQHELVPVSEIFREIDFRAKVLAKLDALAAAKPVVDVAALAAALSGPLTTALADAGHQVDSAAVQAAAVAALQSDAGQAALVKAGNTAESS